MRASRHVQVCQSAASIRAALLLDMTELGYTRSHHLSSVQAVITSKGKPTADVRDRARTASDLHMMIQHDGKERDARQWADILSKVCAFQEGFVPPRPPYTLLCILKWCMPEKSMLPCMAQLPHTAMRPCLDV